MKTIILLLLIPVCGFADKQGVDVYLELLTKATKDAVVGIEQAKNPKDRKKHYLKIETKLEEFQTTYFIELRRLHSERKKKHWDSVRRGVLNPIVRKPTEPSKELITHKQELLACVPVLEDVLAKTESPELRHRIETLLDKTIPSFFLKDFITECHFLMLPEDYRLFRPHRVFTEKELENPIFETNYWYHSPRTCEIDKDAIFEIDPVFIIRKDHLKLGGSERAKRVVVGKNVTVNLDKGLKLVFEDGTFQVDSRKIRYDQGRTIVCLDEKNKVKFIIDNIENFFGYPDKLPSEKSKMP